MANHFSVVAKRKATWIWPWNYFYVCNTYGQLITVICGQGSPKSAYFYATTALQIWLIYCLSRECKPWLANLLIRNTSLTLAESQFQISFWVKYLQNCSPKLSLAITVFLLLNPLSAKCIPIYICDLQVI